MYLPQILLIALYATSLGVHIAKHGEPKEGTYKLWPALTSCAIIFGLLIWGGFFG